VGRVVKLRLLHRHFQTGWYKVDALIQRRLQLLFPGVRTKTACAVSIVPQTRGVVLLGVRGRPLLFFPLPNFHSGQNFVVVFVSHRDDAVVELVQILRRHFGLACLCPVPLLDGRGLHWHAAFWRDVVLKLAGEVLHVRKAHPRSSNAPRCEVLHLHAFVLRLSPCFVPFASPPFIDAELGKSRVACFVLSEIVALAVFVVNELIHFWHQEPLMIRHVFIARPPCLVFTLGLCCLGFRFFFRSSLLFGVRS